MIHWLPVADHPSNPFLSIPDVSHQENTITLLRVIPTMTFLRFVTGKSSDILSGISSGIPSDISSGVRSGILSGISSGILFGILSGKSSGILSGISSGILSDMLSGVLSGISSGILSGRWGPAVLTELGGSQVEVQQCPLSSEGPRLRSSGAHWTRQVPGWGGPAVPTACGSWRRAWRRVGKAEVDMEVAEVDLEVDAEVVEEKEEKEKEKNNSDKI